jgi:hypothetical protein
MHEKELWQYLWDRRSFDARPLDRDFVWVTREQFARVEQHFHPEFHFKYRGRSFRTRGYFFHLHAIRQDELVFVHRDFGNFARFLPLGILHIVFDVLPFAFLMLRRRQSLDAVTAAPER